MRLFRSLALSLGLLALAPSLFAQADPVPRVAWPTTVGGRVTTFAPMTVDAANAAKFSFGAAANGSVFATAPAYAPTPGGASIPITVVGRVPKASVAAAFGRFAAKALPIVSTASALYQLGEELGFGVDPSTNRLVTAGPTGPLLFAHTTAGPWTSRLDAANNWLVGKKALGIVAQDKVVESCHPDPSSTTCYVCRSDNSACEYAYLYSKANDGSAGGGPVTEAQFVDAINARAAWPSTSKLGEALGEVIQAGDSVASEPEAIQGPAQSSSSSSTTDPATGNVTTSNVTNNHVYEGVKITTNQTTVVTVTNSAGVVLSTQATDTSAPAAPDPTPFEMPCGVGSAPPCAVKVDETSSPATVTMADPFPQIQADQAEKLDAIKAADGSTWESVRDFFFLPPATACVPFDMPVVMGIQVPTMNPCPVVGGIQQVVGVLWAIGAFWVMLGWVREVV